jgi:hydroxymethylbilane synthase
LRPDLELLDLRGNVNTRLAKLDADNYDAIILACAGLERLGMGARIKSRLIAPDWLPAVAQGAIAIEQRIGDERVARLISALDDANTRRCVECERAMNRRLHGSCNVPIAGYCVESEIGLTLYGLVGDAGTGRLVRAEMEIPDRDQGNVLGEQVAALLLERGAQEILAGLRTD